MSESMLTMADFTWVCKSAELTVHRDESKPRHYDLCELDLKVQTMATEEQAELLKQFVRDLDTHGFSIGLAGDDEIIGVREGRFEKELNKATAKRNALIKALRDIMEDAE